VSSPRAGGGVPVESIRGPFGRGPPGSLKAAGLPGLPMRA
jgi:hypothetical protein